MRLYPKTLHKGKENLRVNNEQEEYEGGAKGFERHRNPDVNKREKGTEKEVLRINPELEKQRLEDEKKKKFSAELVEVAKQAIKDDNANSGGGSNDEELAEAVAKLSDNPDAQKEYMNETGKPALYQGNITNKFKAWCEIKVKDVPNS